MADLVEPRTVGDYVMPRTPVIHSSIRKPEIEADNFEIEPDFILMILNSVQFGGLPSEDPYAHLVNFLEICDQCKYDGVSDDAIRLRLFSFSLRDRAKDWLRSLPHHSICTWNDLAHKFLARFISLEYMAKMRNQILSFEQYDSEPFCEAWERFKDLIRRCPSHGLPMWLQIQSFYNGLGDPSRVVIDAAAGGALMGRSVEEAYELIELMASNEFQWQCKRDTLEKIINSQKLDLIETMSSPETTSPGKVHISPFISCEICEGSHATENCPINLSWVSHPSYSSSNYEKLSSPSLELMETCDLSHQAPLQLLQQEVVSEEIEKSLTEEIEKSSPLELIENESVIEEKEMENSKGEEEVQEEGFKIEVQVPEVDKKHLEASFIVSLWNFPLEDEQCYILEDCGVKFLEEKYLIESPSMVVHYVHPSIFRPFKPP